MSLVLSGTFSDDSGHHGPGWYLRNPPGRALQLDTQGGAELLVLDGCLVDQATVLGPLSWLRLPTGDGSELCAGDSGVTLYLKTGHLAGLVAAPAAPESV